MYDFHFVVNKYKRSHLFGFLNVILLLTTYGVFIW